MLGQRHFYHRTIRKVVVAFGSLFNDLQVQRYVSNVPKEILKVPLSYGSKEKYISRITSDPNLTKSIMVAVPRISFELTGLSYDVNRKLTSLTRNFATNSSTSYDSQFAPTPYDFSFSLSVYVRNTEDGTQIIEQILPFFTPDFTVTVDINPDMGMKYDLPIILNSVNTTTDYEGDFTSTRLIIWDLEFTAKGYIWPATRSAKVIRTANTNIFFSANNTMANGHVYETSNLVYGVSTMPDPYDAMPDDEFGFSEEILGETYLVANTGGYIVTEDNLKIRV